MTPTIRDDLKLKYPLFYKFLATSTYSPDIVELYVRGYAISKGNRRQYLDDVYRNKERLERMKDSDDTQDLVTKP